MHKSDFSGNSTRAVHDGVKRDKGEHALISPIVQSATYPFSSTQSYQYFVEEKQERSEYDRLGNPSVRALEKHLAALEKGESALLFASGMAAITSILLGSLPAGAHIIMTDNCYWHTQEFCTTFLKRLGIETTLVPVGDYVALENAIVRKKTRFIITESPTNPYLRVVNFERLVNIAKKNRVRTILDGTFGTPMNQTPLEYGIDYVVHSATKYLGGHHDILAGVVISKAARIAALQEAQVLLGSVIAPHNAFLLERGVKTLALRMQKHNENAQAIADYLADHPQIGKVWYPGLESHPDYDIARQQMQGYGGVVSFTLKAGIEGTNRFMDALQIPYIATSLGGTESLVEQPGIVLFPELSEEQRQQRGMPGNLVRYATGIEDSEDLIADLEQALTQTG